MAEIKIFEVAEDEWFVAETPEQAMQCAIREWGKLAYEESTEEFGSPFELSDEALNRLIYHEDDSEEHLSFRRKLDEFVAAGAIPPFYFATGNL